MIELEKYKSGHFEKGGRWIQLFCTVINKQPVELEKS